MMSMLPDITLGIQGFSSSPVIQAAGWRDIAFEMAQLQGSFIEYESSEHAYRANLHSILPATSVGQQNGFISKAGKD